MKSVSITWTPAASTTDQEVVFRKEGDLSWTSNGVLDGDATTTTISGLDDDTIYEIKVNSFCQSAGYVSSEIITITTTTTCEAPIVIEATLALDS